MNKETVQETVHGNIGYAMGSLVLLKSMLNTTDLSESKKGELLKVMEVAYGKLNRCTSLDR